MMDHTYDDDCPYYARWCRIHQYPDWTMGVLTHERYPGVFLLPTGTYQKYGGGTGIQWKEVTVYCGPAAFYPPRGKRGK